LELVASAGARGSVFATSGALGEHALIVSEARQILITGASGAVGVEMAAELAGRGEKVVAMVHRARELRRSRGRLLAPSDGNLEILRADVTDPWLGLGRPAYRRLQAATDLIVHTAAVTAFGLPERLYAAVNDTGTRHVLALAERDRGGPIPLIHVSTAYVCGDRRGVIREDELEAGQRFVNAYEQSKYHAELSIRQARARGVPSAVVRPSVVVGAGKDGATREFTNVYVLLKVLLEGRVATVPGEYDAVLDLVPIDYLTAFLSAVALDFDRASGKTFHVVGDSAVSLLDCNEVLAEYPSFHVPRIVPPQAFSRGALSSVERRYYDRIVALFEPYMARHAVFCAAQARDFLPNLAAPASKTLLRRLLDYCVRRGYLGAALPAVQSVLSSLAESQDLRREVKQAVGAT
jgi:nucleoside-diphosphate-sugar epimerase